MLANKIDIFVVQSLNGLKSDNKKWRNDIKPDQRDEKLKHDLRQRQSLAFLGSLHRSSTRFGANLMIYDVFENLHVSIFHFISPSLSLSLSLSQFIFICSLYISLSFFLFLFLSFPIPIYLPIDLSIYRSILFVSLYISIFLIRSKLFLSFSITYLTSFSQSYFLTDIRRLVCWKMELR